MIEDGDLARTPATKAGPSACAVRVLGRTDESLSGGAACTLGRRPSLGQAPANRGKSEAHAPACWVLAFCMAGAGGWSPRSVARAAAGSELCWATLWMGVELLHSCFLGLPFHTYRPGPDSVRNDAIPQPQSLTSIHACFGPFIPHGW